MSIGASIIVAAILIIVAWQLDKRGAWKKAGKFVLWSLLALAVLAAGIAGYSYWDDWRKYRNAEREAQRQLAMLKSDGITEYLGIKLRSAKNEVRYVLGEPSNMGFDDDDKTYWWEYRENHASHYQRIYFDSDGVSYIYCIGKYNFDCPSLIGVEIGDSETEVLKRLGDNAREQEIADSGRKIFRVGSPTNKVIVTLFQQKVDLLGIVQVSPMERFMSEFTPELIEAEIARRKAEAATQ